MLILAIDTSTKTASIALLNNNEILSEINLNLSVNHSLVLLPSLEFLCRLSSTELSRIESIVCTIGPGSFTGLRVGASTVKGLAVAMGIPIVGVSTLDALAYNLVGSGMLVCPILDAKKNMVYTALYRNAPDNVLEKIKHERVTDIGVFLQAIHEKVVFVGDGATKYAKLIRDILPGLSFFASSTQQYVRATVVGLLGERKFTEGDILDPTNFTPMYLRLSEAEMKRYLR